MSRPTRWCRESQRGGPMTGEDAKWVESLAGIIALYGVYALVPVSVYLMITNSKAFLSATDQTRDHCGRVHYAFVAFTIVLMVAAGLFQYDQSRTRLVLWGSVSGLVDQE